MVDTGHKNKRKSSYKHINKTSIDNVEILRQRVEKVVVVRIFLQCAIHLILYHQPVFINTTHNKYNI